MMVLAVQGTDRGVQDVLTEYMFGSNLAIVQGSMSAIFPQNSTFSGMLAFVSLGTDSAVDHR